MNFICWNCRGTATRGFAGLIKDLHAHYNASLMCLLETHLGGAKAKRVAQRTGFGEQFISDADGQAGGIWDLWDPARWCVKVLAHSNQFIHLKVGCRTGTKWLLTVVYTSPRYQQRASLWTSLCDLYAEIEGPWALIGDFNTIVAGHERQGSHGGLPIRSMRRFREC